MRVRWEGGVAHAQDEITDVLSKTVGETHLGSAPVISVFEEQTALETFQKLDASGRSGIAVVNAANVLTGVTSSSDLKVRGPWGPPARSPVPSPASLRLTVPHPPPRPAALPAEPRVAAPAHHGLFEPHPPDGAQGSGQPP